MKNISFVAQFPNTLFGEQLLWHQQDDITQTRNNLSSHHSKPILPDLLENRRQNLNIQKSSAEFSFEQLCSLRANDLGPFNINTINDEATNVDDDVWKERPISFADRSMIIQNLDGSDENEKQTYSKTMSKISAVPDNDNNDDDNDDGDDDHDNNYFVSTSPMRNNMKEVFSNIPMSEINLTNGLSTTSNWANFDNINKNNNSNNNDDTSTLSPLEPVSSSTPDRSKISCPLPFEEFGFKDVISLLRSMKDVCFINERNRLIYGIGNERTVTIEKLVHEQNHRKRRGYPNIGGYHTNGYRNRGRNAVHRENSYREASATDVRSTGFRARPYRFNNSYSHSYNNFPYRPDNQQSTTMSHQSGISRMPVVSLIPYTN
ncbi:unnamed protein product [Didymodactylos carnosus]|uniref:Uncharacterized protein n=1 Tax=Didymodactylos carnosus TaxID=1234261 RepID=A0A8S2PYC0_9BILA|nr:unnamed protein product [Didymodactylos carnosus]